MEDLSIGALAKSNAKVRTMLLTVVLEILDLIPPLRNLCLFDLGDDIEQDYYLDILEVLTRSDVDLLYTFNISENPNWLTT